MKIKITVFIYQLIFFVSGFILPGISLAQQIDTSLVSDLFAMSINELKNIEVSSASKRSEYLETAPATIYVITSREMEQYGFQDLQEALKSIPSVYLSNPHSWVWGGQRGFLSNFSQTLLMINGREVNNLVAFEGFISRQFATYNIKQIEVLASPGSALYGANALAGIINIITKDASDNFEGTEICFDAGSFNTKAISLLFSKKITDEFKISGSGRLFSSDEEDFSSWVTNTEEYVPGWADNKYLSNYENFGQYENFSQSFPLNFQLEYKGIYAGLNYYYNKQSQGQEKPNWDYTDSEDNRQFALWYAGYRKEITEKLNIKFDYSLVRSKFWGRYYADFWPVSRLQNPSFAEYYQFDTWMPNKGNRAGNVFRMLAYDRKNALVFDETQGDSLYLQNYYASFGDYLMDQGLIDSLNITRDDVHKYFNHIYTNKESQGSIRDKIEFQIDYDFNEKNRFIFGYTFDYIKYVGLVVTDAGTGLAATYNIPVDLSKRKDVYNSIKNGIFLQYHSEFIKNKLWFTLGGRFDHQNHYGSIFNPRSGLVFKPFESSTFKLLYGEAFREGNVFELTGKPDLKPAKLREIELAYSQDIGDIIRNEVVFYNMKVTDFLSSVGSLIGDNVTSVESQTVTGIENSLHYNWKKVSGLVGLAYIFSAKQNATYKTSGEKVEVNLLSIPDFKLTTSLSFTISKTCQISLMNHYVNDYYALGGSSGKKIRIDSYNDLSLTFLLHDLTIKNSTTFNLYFSIKNLLDTEYYHANIRASGTEKFLQNSRYFTARITVKI